MENSEMFEDIRALCRCTGMAIDKIAKKYNQNQDNVAELYMQVMKRILDSMKG